MSNQSKVTTGEVDSFLAQASVLIDKHEELEIATGSVFNLFEILGTKTDEVHTHTRILAELLDPKGTHRQGAVFTKLFAKRVHIDDPGIEDARVCREKPITEGQVDILIETKDTCVVIENKINARDQDRQLERYHAHASKYPTHKVYYLTLDGGKPSDISLGGLPVEKVECISYKSDVIPWLDDCIKEVALIPQIREILAHYRALLRNLTGTSTGELTMELKDLLAKKQGDRYNFEVAAKISDAMKEFSIECEMKFWEELKQGLLKADNERPWRLTEVQDIGDTASKPMLKEVNSCVIKNAHGNGQDKWFYGHTFGIESDSEPSRYREGDVEILLTVEFDGDTMYYSLIPVRQTDSGRHRIDWSCKDANDDSDGWRQRLKLQKNGWKVSDTQRDDRRWWLAWKVASNGVKFLKNRNSLTPEVLCHLSEKDAVGPLVKEIQEAIDLIEGCQRSSE